MINIPDATISRLLESGEWLGARWLKLVARERRLALRRYSSLHRTLWESQSQCSSPQRAQKQGKQDEQSH